MQPVDGGVPLDQVIDAIKRSIKVANISTTSPGRDLRVATVTLTLNTVTARTVGGGIEFRVPLLGTPVRVGASRTQRESHSVEIVFAPPPAPPYEVRDGNVEAALVAAIRTVRAALRHAAGGDDPFELQSSTVSLSFGITKAGKLTLGVDGELSDELTHTLELSLVPAGTAI